MNKLFLTMIKYFYSISPRIYSSLVGKFSTYTHSNICEQFDLLPVKSNQVSGKCINRYWYLKWQWNGGFIVIKKDKTKNKKDFRGEGGGHFWSPKIIFQSYPFLCSIQISVFWTKLSKIRPGKNRPHHAMPRLSLLLTEKSFKKFTQNHRPKNFARKNFLKEF